MKKIVAIILAVCVLTTGLVNQAFGWQIEAVSKEDYQALSESMDIISDLLVENDEYTLVSMEVKLFGTYDDGSPVYILKATAYNNELNAYEEDKVLLDQKDLKDLKANLIALN